MLPDTSLDRSRLISLVIPIPDVPPDSGEAYAQTLRRFTSDGAEAALFDESMSVLELAGLDWEAIEMRFQEHLARRELEELFASGELPSLGG